SLQTDNKVVVFVNDYVEGVIRGEKSIIGQLDLPDRVQVRTIHGEDDMQQRKMIQSEFNLGQEKMVLFVSGDTADVGVDFSGADRMIHYNEPWTIYDKKQQIGRAYREGLNHDLVASTLVVGGTIEEGMYNYIRKKEKAIEKLISGIPISEAEKLMLEKDEKRAGSDLNVDSEFAEYYFSALKGLMRMFGYTKGAGEVGYNAFIREHGEKYAQFYQQMGMRSYQANTARVSAAMISRFMEENGRSGEEVKILDMASGPELMKKHAPKEWQDRIFSLDLNAHHFTNGATSKAMVGSFVDLPIKEGSMDFVTFNLAIQESSIAITKKDYEGVKIFYELNHVLKIGGRASIIFDYSLDYKNKAGFFENLQKFGFAVVEEESGELSAGKNYQAKTLTLKKEKELTVDFDELVADMGAEKIKWFKFGENKVSQSSLRDTRKIISGFKLNGREYEIDLNEGDRAVLAEEQEIITQAEQLKAGRRIEEIPKAAIIQNGFCRYWNGSHYVLFKKLKTDNGAVIIKE
ncbi:MAG: helicase-related protein, partial [Parcubacteria group bacterium]